MQYVKVILAAALQDERDMLIALLADSGYEGFEEQDNRLLAYIESPKFHDEELRSIAGDRGIVYETEIVAAQNWNALWESNFLPVVVDGFCTIRAHFHDIEITTPYSITITPKMSFGTGHHATTQLVMTMMKDLDLEGKTVLDFGTGTGVLAILAEMLGATTIMAIDNDEWSVENAIENAARNHCKNIEIRRGSLEDIQPYYADVILANINRNILLQYMQLFHATLNTGGTIIMSGLLAGDKDIILQAAAGAGLQYVNVLEQSNWIALLFKKL